MAPRKNLISTAFILWIAVIVFFSPGCVGRTLAGSRLLQGVRPEMESPEFWLKKLPDPHRVLLSPEEIRRMNEENLGRDGLYLCNVKALKEEWTREELLALLDEDWQGFGDHTGIRYGRYGHPLGDSFWNSLKRSLDIESIRERNRVGFGLIVKRTDIRVFPTEEVSMNTPDDYEIDRFQHSAISPGSLVGVYHFSRDRLWSYVQAGFIRGWIRATDLALAKERKEALDYEEVKDRLVITGSFVRVFGDSSFRQTAFLAQMGASFPLLDSFENSGFFTIRMPFRESDGTLSFRTGYVPKDEDVHSGFLPYTQEHAARQAFKMLHQPYGWGEMFGARDCSRFIMDIFASFGIVMPRNSKLQARIGISLGEVEDRDKREKKKVLDRAVPLATLLRLPGHIMFYLGKDQGEHYVIHNAWAVQKRVFFSPAIEKIGRTVVSDLSLGKTGPTQSLLDRLTDIQFIGRASEAP